MIQTVSCFQYNVVLFIISITSLPSKQVLRYFVLEFCCMFEHYAMNNTVKVSAENKRVRKGTEISECERLSNFPLKTQIKVKKQLEVGNDMVVNELGILSDFTIELQIKEKKQCFISFLNYTITLQQLRLFIP